MAKSARASRRKENNSKLRDKIFGPQENLRTERLSSKLLALAAQPKPRRPTVDETKLGVSHHSFLTRKFSNKTRHTQRYESS